MEEEAAIPIRWKW